MFLLVFNLIFKPESELNLNLNLYKIMKFFKLLKIRFLKTIYALKYKALPMNSLNIEVVGTKSAGIGRKCKINSDKKLAIG